MCMTMCWHIFENIASALFDKSTKLCICSAWKKVDCYSVFHIKYVSLSLTQPRCTKRRWCTLQFPAKHRNLAFDVTVDICGSFNIPPDPASLNSAHKTDYIEPCDLRSWFSCPYLTLCAENNLSTFDRLLKMLNTNKFVYCSQTANKLSFEYQTFNTFTQGIACS